MTMTLVVLLGDLRIVLALSYALTMVFLAVDLPSSWN